MPWTWRSRRRRTPLHIVFNSWGPLRNEIPRLLEILSQSQMSSTVLKCVFFRDGVFCRHSTIDINQSGSQRPLGTTDIVSGVSEVEMRRVIHSQSQVQGYLQSGNPWGRGLKLAHMRTEHSNPIWDDNNSFFRQTAHFHLICGCSLNVFNFLKKSPF